MFPSSCFPQHKLFSEHLIPFFLDISVTPEIIRAGLPLPREGNPAPIGYSKVMRHCIAYQPHDRPSFDQLIDEFFKMSAADLKLEVEKPQGNDNNESISHSARSRASGI